MKRFLCLAALATLGYRSAAAQSDQPPLQPEAVESSELGPVRTLALRFSDTVDHGRAIRPPQPGGSWASYVANPFKARLAKWGIAVDHREQPDMPPFPKSRLRDTRDGTPYDVNRDRKHWLAQRPKRTGRKTDDRFDAYLLGDFAHRQKVGLWVTSRYWARFTLLNRRGEVVFSRVYPATLRTLALNINRVNREAELLEAEIPSRVLADLEGQVRPAAE